jgi:hypothetical protein
MTFFCREKMGRKIKGLCVLLGNGTGSSKSVCNALAHLVLNWGRGFL